MIKQIMIPVAAFAVTATAVSAFNTDMLKQIDTDLTPSQLSTLEHVDELRQDGASRDEVHAALDEAGITKDMMRTIRTSLHEHREAMHEAIESALESGNYEAFKTAIVGSHLAESITSEEEFRKMIEAHELRESGDYEAARKIMDELGVERGEGRMQKGGMRGFKGDESGFGMGGRGMHTEQN